MFIQLLFVGIQPEPGQPIISLEEWS